MRGVQVFSAIALLLGALVVQGCTETKYVEIEVPVLSDASGDYLFRNVEPVDPETGTQVGFVDLEVCLHNLSGFVGPLRMHFDRDAMGPDPFTESPMVQIQANLWCATQGSLPTARTFPVNFEDFDFGSFVWDGGLIGSYPDQFTTVTVNDYQVSTSLGNHLGVTVNEFGEVVTPSYDLTLHYFHDDGSVDFTDFPPILYLDNTLYPPEDTYGYTMIPGTGTGEWVATIRNLPCGKYETNVDLKGPFNMVFNQEGNPQGTLQVNPVIPGAGALSVTTVVDYVNEVTPINPFEGDSYTLVMRNGYFQLGCDGSLVGLPGANNVTVVVQ